MDVALPPGASIQEYVHHGAQAVYVDIAVPNPLAGHDWSWTVPGGHWFRLVVGRATLTTSKQGGNRGHSQFQIRDGDNLVRARGMHYLEIGENIAYNLTYGADLAAEITEPEGQRIVRAPPIWIPAGWSVGSFTFEANKPGLQTEDQFSQIRLWAEMPYDTGGELAAAIPDWVELGVHSAS